MASRLPLGYLERAVPALAVTLVLATVVFIPVRVLEAGFLPPDDSLRHVAKVFSGKSWPEILVLRPDITIDLHGGWHFVLGAARRLLGADREALLALCIGGLYVLFGITPLPWMKRPESWIAALMLGSVACPQLTMRLCLGRPFLVAEAALMTLMLASSWRRAWTPVQIAGLTLLLAVAVWIHGSYYLFLLPVGAFFLAGQAARGVVMAGAWMCASIAAGLLTGKPVAFLSQQMAHMSHVVGHDASESMMTVEMRASDGSLPLLAIVFAVAILDRIGHGRWRRERFQSPLLMLGLLGWVLGLQISRFWLDWGLPAVLVWIALQIDDAAAELVPARSIQRLAGCTLACAALYFASTADRDMRWSGAVKSPPLSADDPAQAPWLPDRGGILYSPDMGAFYQTFWANPKGPWRYALGFDFGLMTDENLAVVQAFQATHGDIRTLLPWVQRMGPADRLVVRSTPANEPRIPQLEWRYFERETWVGRLPRHP